MKKRLVLLPLVLLFSFLIYSLLFGKLFPYSPVITGFTRHELGHVVVYIEKGAAYPNLQEIDSYINKVETFHSLSFKQKPHIYIFGNQRTWTQRSPSRARFCAYYNGAIIVSPQALQDAQAGLISMEIYLRHELSHSLLYQHTGIIKAFGYPKWLMEGIAMYSANQMGTSWYPDKEETLEYIRRGNFIHPKQYKTKNEKQVNIETPNRIAFIYSEFACIVDYLVSSYGMEKFHHYMVRLLDGADHDAVFFEEFQIDFEEFIARFRQQTVAGS
ncbi:MAG TPA: hypothetical protein PLP19_21845 [bacterium]|nr:hypothetical protein [bacterium]HPN46142.1 hypothetical protein [bacterium]